MQLLDDHLVKLLTDGIISAENAMDRADSGEAMAVRLKGMGISIGHAELEDSDE
jgi:Tfp pilus assembly ATPase PilU